MAGRAALEKPQKHRRKNGGNADLRKLEKAGNRKEDEEMFGKLSGLARRLRSWASGEVVEMYLVGGSLMVVLYLLLVVLA